MKPSPESLHELRLAAADRQFELTELEVKRHILRMEITDRLTGGLDKHGKVMSATKAAEAASVHDDITAYNHAIALTARELAVAQATAERCRLYLDSNVTPREAGPA